MYKIGDFATLTQVSVKTLRFYDAIGLLRPAEVDPSSGYRYYGAVQVEQLNRVLVLKDLGLSLGEIRGLLGRSVGREELAPVLTRRYEQLRENADRVNARLLRAAGRLRLLENGGARAAQEVAIRTAAARVVASIRDVVAGHLEAERLFDELLRWTGGFRARWQRGVIWHQCRDGHVDCEAVVFLPGRISSRGPVRVHVLPPQRVVSLVYRGDEQYPAAYRELRSWLAETGTQVVGPKREIFLSEGGPDSESVTEIQFPIAA
jgi:DNA-binding transcriptional MerR regulator